MDYTQLISTLGFPIVACLALGFFIKYIFDINREDRTKMEEKYETLVDKTTEAIKNNTVALIQLIEKIGGDRDDCK